MKLPSKGRLFSLFSGVVAVRFQGGYTSTPCILQRPNLPPSPIHVTIGLQNRATFQKKQTEDLKSTKMCYKKQP